MRPAGCSSKLAGMTDTPQVRAARSIDWLLVLSLSTLPLLQVLFSMAGWAEAIGRPQTPLLLALAISVIWVCVLVASRTPRPILTLILAGALAAVVTSALSLFVPAVARGDLANLLDPVNVVATVLATTLLYTLWGLLSGLLVLAVRRLRGRRAHPA